MAGVTRCAWLAPTNAVVSGDGMEGVMSVRDREATRGVAGRFVSKTFSADAGNVGNPRRLDGGWVESGM